MIKEAYCSYEVSKLLKEKGFDEACYSYYMTTKTLHTTFHNRVHVEEEPHFNSGDLNGMYDVDKFSIEDICSAPTLQMAMKWLREKYYIYADPIKQGNYNDCSEYYTWIVARMGIIHRNPSVADKLSYEEAVEAALKYSLENLI